MTKIAIADATDDQRNRVIALLDGWKHGEYWTKGISIEKETPNYLHDWSLCGPLPLPKGDQSWG